MARGAGSKEFKGLLKSQDTLNTAIRNMPPTQQHMSHSAAAARNTQSHKKHRTIVHTHIYV